MHYAVVFILAFCLFITSPASLANAAVLDLSGRGAILIDAKNGQVLFEKNADMQFYPASTTKVLTGIIALEKTSLNDMVTVTRNAVSTGGTSIGLQQGEKIKMESLLYASLLNSANDASVAIAEYISGSVNDFAQFMNEKTQNLGAQNSHFVNPHGMPDTNHKTTARDLAIISRYAMQNEQFRHIVSMPNKEIERNVSKENPHTWMNNHNKLLFKYENAIGIKTGYTNAAKHCIVGAACNGSRELIAVVLKSDSQNDMYSDAVTMLDYGFNNYKLKQLVKKGEIITHISVPRGKKEVDLKTRDNFNYNFPVEYDGNVQMEIETFANIKAPLKKGDKAAELIISCEDKILGRVDLIAAENVSPGLIYRPFLLCVIVLMLILLIWIASRRYKNRRKYIFNRKR
ncbi:MAG: D-alanyl-D-alanine carboxypeptidase [Clostridiales bacterium]|nr:D-alanyl-D-alanine carboxypeptidase [Clostridiales bacterium]